MQVFRDRLHSNKYGDYCKKMGSGKLVRPVHFFLTHSYPVKP